MPHIVHSNKQNNNNNNNINIQPMKVMMDANWKWEASVAPRWTSSFLGTNDVFGRDIDDIVSCSECQAPRERHKVQRT